MTSAPPFSGKLKAPDQDLKGTHTDNYAHLGFKQLSRHGQRFDVVSASGVNIPDEHYLTGKHIQGIAVSGNCALLTTSALGGFIIRAEEEDGRYVVRDQGDVCPAGFDHPGGIQAQGDYLAVPLYNSKPKNPKKAQVHFYRFSKGLQKVAHLTVLLNRRAYCVGLAHLGTGEQAYYVLAVVTHCKGKTIHFFATPQGVPLEDLSCSFRPLGAWKYRKENTKKWGSDRKWGLYGNNISLLTDAADRLFFIGMRTKSNKFISKLPGGGPAVGEDIADLFEVHLDRPKGIRLVKQAKLHAKLNDRAAFRWGASARTVSPTEIGIVVANGHAENHDTRVKCNELRLKTDA